MASPTWLHGKLFIPIIIFINCQTTSDLALQILQEALTSALFEAVNCFTSLLHAQVFSMHVPVITVKILLQFKILLQAEQHTFWVSRAPSSPLEVRCCWWSFLPPQLWVCLDLDIYTFRFFSVDLQLKFGSFEVALTSPINIEDYYLLPSDNLILLDFYYTWYWQCRNNTS